MKYGRRERLRSIARYRDRIGRGRCGHCTVDFVLEPTSSDFVRALFRVERFVKGRMSFVHLVTWTDDFRDTLSTPIGVSFEMTILSKGLGAMTTEIGRSHFRDILDIEGMFFEHFDVHRIGIVAKLSSQLPHLLSRLVHANTQL